MSSLNQGFFLESISSFYTDLTHDGLFSARPYCVFCAASCRYHNPDSHHLVCGRYLQNYTLDCFKPAPPHRFNGIAPTLTWPTMLSCPVFSVWRPVCIIIPTDTAWCVAITCKTIHSTAGSFHRERGFNI